MTCSRGEQCLNPRCKGAFAWTSKSNSGPEMAAFLADVKACMQLFDLPFGKAAAKVYHDARKGQCVLA